MRFISTNRHSVAVTARMAVLNGIAPDGGLYMPEAIPALSARFFKELRSLSLPEIALNVAAPFFADEIGKGDLCRLVENAFSFQAPLVPLYDNLFSLELFHGPTLAFKDFGARFMAQLFVHFVTSLDRELVILTATSGDTGSAVANGFFNLQGIKVVLLYPSGKVSEIQEKQLTTLGGNISALEVLGTFDDCQRMAKEAFLDPELREHLNLTSANSINISRLIPQSVYYMSAFGALPKVFKHVFLSVPSGNFGNLTAGLFAKKMGLPVTRFVAATNINDVIPQYLASGEFRPRPSQPTHSNAMDVGNPSNFARMQWLYRCDVEDMRRDIAGFRFTDVQTFNAIAQVDDANGYVLDPHGAIAYLGLRQLLNETGDAAAGSAGIFLETAHPAKFKPIVDKAIRRSVEMPERLAACLMKPKLADIISPALCELKDFLLQRFRT
jgi:threonine synthase